MFGRRGEVVWKKAAFLGGGGRRDYDAYRGFGLIFPLYLTQAVHCFGWGEQPNFAWAIPLRSDRDFATRALISDWCGPLCLLAGLAFLPLCCSGYSTVLTIIALAVLVLSATALLAVKLTAGSRDRDIRLILGRHDWGSSDPATWHEDLLEGVVKPQKKFGVPSFEELAEQLLEEGRWAEAMWAARLCAAVEDPTRGERLTDEILEQPKVAKKLARVRGNPRERKAAFGESIPLSDWVSGNLDAPVFRITRWG
jgi:hypothetical protein